MQDSISPTALGLTREEVVNEFHLVMGQPSGESLENKGLLLLRLRLLEEEFTEVMQAGRVLLAAEDPYAPNYHETRVNFLSELADLQYILSGTADSFGLPLEQAFCRIHVANMKKIGPDGPKFRNDGKLLKPDDWEPADLKGLIE